MVLEALIVMARKIISVLLSFFIILNSILLMANADEGERISPIRAGNVTVDNIKVFTPTQPFFQHGTYANGKFRIEINFTLAEEMMNVNVTLNVTHDSGFEAKTSNKGNLPAGNHEIIMQNSFDFTDPGFYNINATVGGWCNVTAGMVDGFIELEEVNFTTIIDFTINIRINALNVDGIYGKKDIMIGTVIRNTGNDFVDTTKVSIDIINITGEISEFLPWNWRMVGLLPPNVESGVIIFFWMPSAEGENSFYDLTITATNTSTGRSVNNTMQVQIMNITLPHIVNMSGFDDTGLIPSTPFDVTVYLNNTGNIEGKCDVHLEIYPKGEPGNVLIDLTQTSGFISPEEEIGSSRYDRDVIFSGLQINASGLYKIRVSLVGTAEVMIKDMFIAAPCNCPPELINVSLSPNPIDANMMVGEEITFSVVYKHLYGDIGTVKLHIDNISHDMINGSDNWGGEVTFTYTWMATAGNHSYFFVAEDARGGLILNEDFTYNFTIYEDTGGWLRGKVRDEDGYNVRGATVTIYHLKLNGAGKYVIDKYYNTTTDANGNYSKLLPFNDTKYVIMLDLDWLISNGYKVRFQNKQNFELNFSSDVVWINYTLDLLPGDGTTTIRGKVNDTNGDNISGVTITVEIFVDVHGNMTVLVAGANATINTTIRTWMNLTAVTDANGSYEIEGIPYGFIHMDEAKVTGTKVYRHDIEEPEGAITGWWLVTAQKTGYYSEKSWMEFGDWWITWWNITWKLDIPPKYTITGKVDPASATVKIGTTPVAVDNVTGYFTISNLIPGTYKLTFSVEGYNSTNRSVTITNADIDLGTVIGPHSDIKCYTITIGPIPNAGGGVIVNFVYENISYMATTHENGMAIFTDFPLAKLPEGIIISAKKGDDIITWKLGEDIPPFEPGEDGENEGDRGKSNGSLLIILIVLIIIFTIFVITILIIKNKIAATENKLIKETEPEENEEDESFF